MRPGNSPLAALVLLLAAACGDDRDEDVQKADAGETSVCSTCGGCTETFSGAARNHVVGPIDYTDPPPVGGDHDPCWATWGVHEEPVPDEMWVHNLEHGGVVFLYDCPGGCVEEQPQLDEIADLVGRSKQALLTPYPGLPTRFAVVAWERRLQMDCIDVQAAAAFYSLNVASEDLDEGTLTANPPAECQ